MPTSVCIEKPDSLLAAAMPVGLRMGTTPVSLGHGLPICIDPWHWSTTFYTVSTHSNRSPGPHYIHIQYYSLEFLIAYMSALNYLLYSFGADCLEVGLFVF